MRQVRLGVWCLGILVSSAAPAFCQWIDFPNGSGRSIPANAPGGTFRQTVMTDGDVAMCLRVFQNMMLRFSASGTTLTDGPTLSVSADIPFSSFQLAPGDVLVFAFTVLHLNGCDSGSRSTVVSVIPVVAPCTASPPPPTSYLPRETLRRIGGNEVPAAARREDYELEC